MPTKNRDRRVEHTCQLCKEKFKGKRGQRAISKWCPKCENVELICLGCDKKYLIRRKFYNFRSSKVCGMKCYGLLRKNKYAKENHPCWKGGTDHVIAYRARKAGASGTHTLQEWETLKAKYMYMCLCCKKNEPKIKLEQDHIVPLSRGGRNDIGNIQPLCRSCNSIKLVKTIDFRPY